MRAVASVCVESRRDPAESTGDDACPFTTLYWDYLLRHETVLRGNQRMLMQLKNLARLDASRRGEITARAALIRSNDGCPPAA